MKKIFYLTLFSLFITLSFSSLTTHAASDTAQLILVNKKTNQLAFYENHELVAIFSVATGKTSTLTPEGTFSVVKKIVNPYYNKGKIAGGSPKNPLGYRWMGINARGTSGGTYGIHGNNNEKSIGTYASAGCIRMHNNENIWLYDRVKTGTKVVIYNSSVSFDKMAKTSGYSLSSAKVTPVSQALYATFQTKTYDFVEGAFKLHSLTFNSTQTFYAFEKKGNWYHVNTYKGDKWISSSTIVPFEKKIQKIKLTKKTPLYSSYNNTSKIVSYVAPQVVTSFENMGSWHHIHTWLGDKWIKI